MTDPVDTVELIEQREFTGVPDDFLLRFFGHIAAELKSMSLDVPGDPQARRFPLEFFGSTVKCLVVRVDVRDDDATIELSRELFENERSLVEQMIGGLLYLGVAGLSGGSPGPVGPDPKWIETTVWRAAQQSAKPDRLPS